MAGGAILLEPRVGHEVSGLQKATAVRRCEMMVSINRLRVSGFQAPGAIILVEAEVLAIDGLLRADLVGNDEGDFIKLCRLDLDAL